jgi:uncharacterized protein YlxW (UPF0749 family)
MTMSTEALQVAVLIATGAVAVLVPLLIFLLASQIRNAAQESTTAALSRARRQHEETLAEFTREYDRSLAESTRQHDRAVSEYARQHERALTELAAEHRRLTSELGFFSQKRHEVYARLYARYRHAIQHLAAALTGHEPEFQKFSRDDLLRYLKRRDIREREAADAISSMDRGDIFAMKQLMVKLHWRTALRDVHTAFERAKDFELTNELYLSEAVRTAVATLRRKVDALLQSITREESKSDLSRRVAMQDELHAAAGELLGTIRVDLGATAWEKPPKELDRVARGLALAAPSGPADKRPSSATSR